MDEVTEGLNESSAEGIHDGFTVGVLLLVGRFEGWFVG
jgi:hypothetical protein